MAFEPLLKIESVARVIRYICTYWEKIMKKLVMAGAALAMMASTAIAERYVMITHTQGTDPFWPVVEKGGRDAAAAIGADFESVSYTHLTLPPTPYV